VRWSITRGRCSLRAARSSSLEFVAATRGLGYLLSFAQSTYNAALMFALVLLIMVVVLVIFAVAGQLERRLLRWN